MEGGKIKNIKKQTLLEFLAVILLLAAFCFMFFKEAYGANPKAYNHTGYCNINVGGSTVRIDVAFNGKADSKLNDDGHYRDDFFGATHKIKVSQHAANSRVWLTDGTKDYMTEKDTQGHFNTIYFKVTISVPAHYYCKDTSVTDSSSGIFKYVTESGSNTAYGFPGSFGHYNQNYTKTVWVRLNLSNAHMTVDNKATWHNATLNLGMYRNSYTVSLYDSINNTSNSQNVNCGDSAWLSSPSAPGYTFDGWYEGNTRYDGNSNLYVCGGNRSLSAGYTAQSHYVTFDTQGGTFPSSLKSQTELDGCKIIPNGIYSIKSNCGSNMYIHVYGAGYNKTQDNATAICIYGGKDGSQTQWVIERYKNTQYYTITSYHNGLALSLAGSPTNNSPGTGQRGKQLELWSMEKDIIDYQWYFKENNGHLEIYNRSTNQCLDVYAAGTTDATPIQQYNPNHSYAQWWDFEPVVQTDYPFKLQYANYNLLTPSISPQRGSDKFLGWSTDKNATSPTYTANSVCNIYGNSNVTLYAIYQARATVSYDANGGSNASLPKPKVVNVGDKITLASAGTMGRDNYVFLGWSTDPHATKNYNAADSEVTVNSSGNVVYYAIWKNATGNADLSNVITGDGMFTNDTELEGQNGTTYNSIHDGLDYAKPDGGVDEPGYYIEK